MPRYWRLLSTNPKAAKRVILSECPQLKAEYQEVLSDDMLYTMLEEMNTVSAVYYRKAEEFITPTRGPEPITMHSPIPEDELDDLEREAIGDSDSDSDNDNEEDKDDLNIFSDEEEPVYEGKIVAKKSERKEEDSFEDLFN